MKAYIKVKKDYNSGLVVGPSQNMQKPFLVLMNWHVKLCLIFLLMMYIIKSQKKI